MNPRFFEERIALNIFKKSLVAAVATSFVVAGGALAAPALAQDVQNINDTVVSLIKPNQQVSLTIHKHAKTDQNGTQKGDGSKIEDTSNLGNPLQNAKFKVELIDVTKGGQKLTPVNQEWWRAVETLNKEKKNPADITGTLTVGDYTYTVASSQEGLTTQEGTLALTGLAQGLYRVTEVEAPAGYVASQTAPFLVTLPMTNPKDRSSWNYDVHVYPKNQAVTDENPSKTVADANKHAGDVINYTISAPVISEYLEAGNGLAAFHMRDIYPNTRLEDPQVTAVGIFPKGDSAEYDAQRALEVLVLDQDYKVLVGNGNKDTDGAVNIGLTKQGLQKLTENFDSAKPGIEVKAQLTFKVSALPEANQDQAVDPAVNTIELRQTNNSNGLPPEPTTPPTVPPTTPPTEPDNPAGNPRSYWGNLKLEKKGLNKEAVQGAEFEVWTCKDADHLTERLMADGKGFTGTTNAEGVAYIRGIHASNFADNAKLDADKEVQYCLVETKSPAGYQLLAKPVEFKIMADLTNHNVPLTSLVAEIENTRDNGGFNLPLTGGQGVAFILGAGLLLIVMGGGAYYLLKRREA